MAALALPCPTGERRRPRSLLKPAILALLLLAAFPAARLIGAGPIEASKEALAQARHQASLAATRALRFEEEAKAAAHEAARARAAEAAAAARVQSAEADIAAAEARIGLVEQLRARQRARLAARQAPIVRLTAALQVMARRPPALALVQPGSLADVAHVRALLASALPVIEARTAALRAEVDRGTRLRAEADEAVAARRTARARLERERVALASLAARHRAQSHALTDAAMLEQDRAIALGARARDIVDLMGKLDEQAALGERLAALPGPLPRPAIPGAALPLPPQLVRSAPAALPFRMPVVGRLATGFGEVSESGVRARGLTLLPAPRAQVVAPAAGRIAYAGPFHGYGRIVIIDHQGGWTTLLTGLASLGVRVGDTVDRGSPIGRAAASRPTITIELRHHGTPIDIARLANG
jgi:septal ring factor EnvC (AmiA/AmiB activator)